MNAANIIQIATVCLMHSRRKLSTIGVYAVNDGKILKRLGERGSCTLATAEKLLAHFDRVWPADLEWPKAIARPAKKRVAA